jgi:hypothetical protein
MFCFSHTQTHVECEARNISAKVRFLEQGMGSRGTGLSNNGSPAWQHTSKLKFATLQLLRTEGAKQNSECFASTCNALFNNYAAICVLRVLTKDFNNG